MKVVQDGVNNGNPRPQPDGIYSYYIQCGAGKHGGKKVYEKLLKVRIPRFLR
ncbi:MAG: hypothetical protein ACXWFZ_12235 [Nitrososphaeraceae archaeon]